MNGPHHKGEWVRALKADSQNGPGSHCRPSQASGPQPSPRPTAFTVRFCTCSGAYSRPSSLTRELGRQVVEAAYNEAGCSD